MKSFFSKFTPNHWLLFAIAVGLFFDAIVHLQHPAYRFYKSNLSSLRSDVEVFKRQIRAEFVPSMESLISNVTVIAEGRYKAFTDDGVDEFVDEEESTVEHAAPSSLSGDFYLASHTPMVRIDGWDYRLGDDYLGEPIVYLSPSVVRTSHKTYHLRRSAHSSSVQPQSRPVTSEAVNPYRSLRNVTR